MYTDLVMEDLEEGIEDPQGHLRDLQKVVGASEHLLSLIEDVLDLAKVESGKTELELDEFLLMNILEDVLIQAAPLVDKNENAFKVNFDFSETLKVTTDKKRMIQILLNLLSNSSKFTAHGVISMRASQDLDYLIFQVEDTGIGMTEEQMGKVWDEFEQADSSTSKKFGGTGLGLALTKKLTEILGGQASMTSTPGVGTCVTLRIPLRSTQHV
jgi:signal transduction histidine kinase